MLYALPLRYKLVQAIKFELHTAISNCKMEKISLFLLFILGGHLVLYAQCPVAPVLLTTQAQVNAFPVTYPNCHDLGVRFEVKGAGITDLTPLSLLNSTTKNFYVNFNPDLTTLTGLENMTTVLGDFTIEANPLLTDLHGLEGLSTLDRLLKIQHNVGLLTMEGLGNGSVTHLGSLVIIENSSLTDLSTGLDNLQTVSEYILFNLNSSLPTINTMNNLTTVGWYLSIEDNDAMTTMDAFNSLTDVGSPGLLWNFEVNKHANLVSLDNFISLNHIWHNMSISNNDALAGMSFPSLDMIDGQLSIAANTALTSLTGLGDFMHAGSLVISGNTSLPECEALGVCRHLNNGGSASISNNAPGCNSVSQVLAACSALPVTLTYFKGNDDNGSILLSWQTASEEDNDFFQVEYGRDGIHFSTIGTLNGKGNTATLNNYSFRHTFPSKGSNYYRLKQVDFDGRFSYSNIVRVEMGPGPEIELFPNPTTGYVKLRGDLAEGTVRLIDVTGRLIAEQQLPDHYLIDMTREAPGIYFIEIQMGSEQVIKKVVKEDSRP